MKKLILAATMAITLGMTAIPQTADAGWLRAIRWLLEPTVMQADEQPCLTPRGHRPPVRHQCHRQHHAGNLQTHCTPSRDRRAGRKSRQPNFIT